MNKETKQTVLPTNFKRVTIPSRRTDDIIIDLTGRQPSRDLLIYGCHENAKPYLQDYAKPSIEDINNGGHFFLRDLLRIPDPNDQGMRTRLRDYFEQLYALLGGKRWFILVPDDWGALWQEMLIKSVPLARNNVFLLWRSVAAIIGIIDKLDNPHENDTVAVVDIQQGGLVDISKLTLALGKKGEVLIPQRKSYTRHKGNYKKLGLPNAGPIPKRAAFLYGKTTDYFLTGADLARITSFVKSAKFVVAINNIGVEIPPSQWVMVDGAILEKGVELFIAQRDEGKIPYYDELEALSLVVQTEDERILAKPLVEANEKSPGGQEIITETIKRAAILKRESNYVDLVLCMGEATPDAPLKIKRHEFNKSLVDDHSIDLSARVTPGQGMAVVTVMSDFLRDPIELDFLRGMTGKNEKGEELTISFLEKEMERSFPPDAPDVESDNSLWEVISNDVQAYLADKCLPDGNWFAKAQTIYPQGVNLPQGASPLERLRRKNVFGNAPKHRHPQIIRRVLCGQHFDFKSLFQKLGHDYKNSSENELKEIIRLIAWTYASDEPAFERIRRETVKHVLDYAQGRTSRAPLYQEMTLCSNLCVLPNEWLDCLRAIEYRIRNYRNNVSRDFYLLYNLLQFHPKIISDTGYFKNDSCWRLARHISHWYHVHRLGGGVAIGYILKSILYLLRCRRFDGKIFLTREHDPEHFAIIAECLNFPVHRLHENLRQLVIEYLNNKGSIDGLPVD